MSVNPWIWGAFFALVAFFLALDLFIFHPKAHTVSMREAAAWTAVWVVLGLGFGGLVWIWQGSTAAGEYLAGYLIEKSLSVDNIFVFALLLAYFGVPTAYQHRVLFWGVIGAIVLRAAFIVGGAALLEAFHWVVYVFGALLVLTGVRMALDRHDEVHPERNPVLRLAQQFIPIMSEYRDQRYFVRDLVLTSNIFAVLGLRALYFMLAGMMHRFVYLQFGLAAILVFVGAKMLAAEVHISHSPTPHVHV